MDKFIYVFCAEARDIMLAHGFTLLKTDPVNGIYAFENSEKLTFANLDVSYITTNTLTF